MSTFTNPQNEAIAVQLTEALPSFPLSLTDIVLLINSAASLPSSYLEFVDQAAEVYITSANSDTQIVWDAIKAAGVDFNSFDNSISALLSGPDVPFTTKTDIVNTTQDGLTDDALDDINTDFNSAATSRLNTALSGVEQALFFIEVYEQYFRFAIPPYRYNPMREDLETARDELNTVISLLST